MWYALLSIIANIVYIGIFISLIIFAWPVISVLLLITLVLGGLALLIVFINHVMEEREINDKLFNNKASINTVHVNDKHKERTKEDLRAQQLQMREEILELAKDFTEEERLLYGIDAHPQDVSEPTTNSKTAKDNTTKKSKKSFISPVTKSLIVGCIVILLVAFSNDIPILQSIFNYIEYFSSRFTY
jgi:ABC-type multidrug transport system fused ATPase/permease subunit